MFIASFLQHHLQLIKTHRMRYRTLRSTDAFGSYSRNTVFSSVPATWRVYMTDRCSLSFFMRIHMTHLWFKSQPKQIIITWVIASITKRTIGVTASTSRPCSSWAPVSTLMQTDSSDSQTCFLYCIKRTGRNPSRRSRYNFDHLAHKFLTKNRPLFHGRTRFSLWEPGDSKS